MPIYGEGQVQGVVLVMNKGNKKAFTTQDEDVLSAICSHISAAIGKDRSTFAEVVEACEKSMRKTGSQLWSNSGASQRRKLLYQPALEGLRGVLHAEAAAIMLVDRKTRMLETEVVDGPLPPHRTPVGQGVAGEAVEHAHAIRVDENDRSWFDEVRHSDYVGSGMEVRNELVVPLFDTSRKCLGVIKCINKVDAPGFSEEDMQYVTEVAHHLEMMLEGPDAGLRRVLALSRQRMQLQSGALLKAHQCKVLANLDRAEHLPHRPGQPERDIDPYVTFNIVRDNPLNMQASELKQLVLRKRLKDRTKAMRRFAKSHTILEESNPKWDETIPVTLPPNMAELPSQELWVHLLLWDYDALKEDDLIAQVAIPLTNIPQTVDDQTQAHKLLPIPGQEQQYDLSSSKIWLSFTTDREFEDEWETEPRAEPVGGLPAA